MFGVLVEAEVSKVHEHILHVLFGRHLVVLGAKPHESFITEVSFNGVVASDEYIQP